MCDKGIIETNPEVMKLEYCIVINEALQKRIVDGISKLLGTSVVISNPKKGEYPEDRNEYYRNTVIVSTELPNNYKTQVVTFSLKELPGCCGVLVSYHTQVSHQFQGKGINSFLQEIKEQIARDNNYSCLMATVTSENKAQIHILEKFGWEKVSEFKNCRTSNTVLTFVKNL